MSKEIIKIDSCIPKVGKTSGKAYHHLNGTIFIHEKEIGRKLEDNVGKTFEVEIDRSNPKFAKITEIYGETEKEPAIEVVNCTGKPGKTIAKEEAAAEELKIIKTKPNSRTFGKGNDQIKLYFDEVSELEKMIKELETQNLMPADWKSEGSK